MYSLTDDYKFVAQMIESLPQKKNVDELMEKAGQVSGQLISDYPDDYVLITTTRFHKEIYDFLKKNGKKEEHIINVGAVTGELYRQQYFDDAIMKAAKDEIFVDGGCYDGSTSRIFAEWCGGGSGIYSFPV